VQSAWPSLFHSSGVRTSTMMVLPVFVVSLGFEVSEITVGELEFGVSVFAEFVVVELQLMAYKEEAIIKNANAIFFIMAKFIFFLWICGD